LKGKAVILINKKTDLLLVALAKKIKITIIIYIGKFKPTAMIKF